MLLHWIARSVGRRTCFRRVPMLQNILEQRIVCSSSNNSNIKLMSTNIMQDEAAIVGNHHPKIATVEAEYEKAIKALNTLQSNADTLRLSIARNDKQKPLEETVKYLHRSGLSFEQLEQLPIIHVSGTKGKGSTCALTESILRAHGVRTGFFSSPHLVSVSERIRINGQPISKSKFTQAFWRVFKRLEKAQEYDFDMPPYFKFLTILSFHIFLEEHVDVTVLEVGIGGELDCTNIVRHTKTVGISSLGLEHTQLLGNTLEEIAWQKAGIIKPNSIVYTSVKQPECLAVIRERAAEKNATLYEVPEFALYSGCGVKSELNTKKLNFVTQLNGSLAIQLAYDWLRNQWKNFPQELKPNTTELTAQATAGLINCSWPGRCQLVNFANLRIHLDGAHTVESMCVCGSWFDQVTRNSKNPKVLIFNTTGDRDSIKLLNILRKSNHFDCAYFVPNIASGSFRSSDNLSVFGISDQLKRARMHASNWQALEQDALTNVVIDQSTTINSQVFGSILDSLHFVREKFGNVQEVDVLVTGSLHLIGATVLALDEFKRRLEQT